MDGWMVLWMDGKVNSFDGWMNGFLVGMDQLLDDWLAEWMGGWMDGSIDVWIHIYIYVLRYLDRQVIMHRTCYGFLKVQFLIRNKFIDALSGTDVV